MALTTKTKSSEKENVPTFSKEQLINSKKYSNRQDALGTLLDDGEQYTIKQVDSILDEFMKKGKVK